MSKDEIKAYIKVLSQTQLIMPIDKLEELMSNYLREKFYNQDNIKKIPYKTQNNNKIPVIPLFTDEEEYKQSLISKIDMIDTIALYPEEIVRILDDFYNEFYKIIINMGNPNYLQMKKDTFFKLFEK